MDLNYRKMTNHPPSPDSYAQHTMHPFIKLQMYRRLVKLYSPSQLACTICAGFSLPGVAKAIYKHICFPHLGRVLVLIINEYRQFQYSEEQYCIIDCSINGLCTQMAQNHPLTKQTSDIVQNLSKLLIDLVLRIELTSNLNAMTF